MLEKYSPGHHNKHTLRLTFNYGGYVGHVAFCVGGNCKGVSVLETPLDFLEDCDEDYMDTLIENDCNLTLYTNECDEWWFSLELHSGEEVCVFDDLDADDISEFVVAVEIVDCVPDD